MEATARGHHQRAVQYTFTRSQHFFPCVCLLVNVSGASLEFRSFQKKSFVKSSAGLETPVLQCMRATFRALKDKCPDEFACDEERRVGTHTPICTRLPARTTNPISSLCIQAEAAKTIFLPIMSSNLCDIAFRSETRGRHIDCLRHALTCWLLLHKVRMSSTAMRYCRSYHSHYSGWICYTLAPLHPHLYINTKTFLLALFRGIGAHCMDFCLQWCCYRSPSPRPRQSRFASHNPHRRTAGSCTGRPPRPHPAPGRSHPHLTAAETTRPAERRQEQEQEKEAQDRGGRGWACEGQGKGQSQEGFARCA